jgi:hypothetical protein
VLGVTGGRASACPHGPAAGARKAAAARSQAPRDSGGETQGSDRVRARTTSAASYSVPLQVPMHQAWLDRATLPAATVDRQGHGTRPRMLPVHMRASDGHPQRLPDRVLPSAGLRPRRTVLMPHGMRSRYTARFATDRLFGLQGSPPRLIVAPRARRSEIVDCARLARSVLGVAERMVLLVSPPRSAGHRPRSASKEAGRRFIAITDPGTPLQGLAERGGYRAVFHGWPSIGGRYSALSDFGMIPGAAAGIDVSKLLDRAERNLWSRQGDTDQLSRHSPPRSMA